jgi:hypothetical protein
VTRAGAWLAPWLFTAAMAAPPPAHLRAGGGFHGLFPSASVAARSPVAETVELEARYEMVAGLAHDLSLTGRVHRGPWSAGVAVANGFFGVEELGGITVRNAPLGEGITTSALAARALVTARGHSVRLEGALTLRWYHLDEVSAGTQDRVFDPTVHHAHLGIAVDWRGGWFLRGRAVVPIQADLAVIGFFPVLSVGAAWAL